MRQHNISPCAVLGAGCWGVTIAGILARKGAEVRLWEIDGNRARHLRKTRRIRYMPYYRLPGGIAVSSDIKGVTEGTRLIIFAVPSRYVRDTAKKIKPYYNHQIIVSASKGIEYASFMRMSQVIEQELSGKIRKPVAVLSGPSHAEEVSQKIPTSIVIASRNRSLACALQELFMSPTLRVYRQSDVAGTEWGAAIKNIIAVAAGIGDGLGLGDNAKSALITRGIVEIKRLGIRCGARKQTFDGLSGLGDLITTCISRHSRNRAFGELIGRGKSVRHAMDAVGMTIEGYDATKTVYNYAKNHHIDMPITNEIYRVLYRNKNPQQALFDLMTRSAKSEG